MNRFVVRPVLLFSLLAFPIACLAQDGGDDGDCAMYVRPVIPIDAGVAYHYFDEKRAEQIAVMVSGDVVIVRFNAQCDLGFDAVLFRKEPFKSAAERRRATSYLVRLLRDSDEHNRFMEKSLDAAPEFESSEFRLAVPGMRLDEAHLFRLVDVETSPDIDSTMFSYALSYSWLPPSGE